MAALAEIDLTTRRSRSRPDFLLILAAAALSAAGLVMIYTITAPRLEAAGVDPSGDMVRQAFFMAGGAVVFIAASFIGPRQWKELAPYAYVAALLLLLLVLTPIGASRQGAQRWIPLGPIDLQPAEFAKPAMILALAALLSASEEARVGWARVGQTLALVVVPSALIFVQPDLGTMLVFAFVAVVMLFAGGANVRQLALLLVGAVIAVIFAFQLDILKDYQLDRLTGFLNSGDAEQTLNYNQTQSEIAIASGGLFGKGLSQGSQTNGAFVPAQRTDFIFTAVAEQLGFVGSAVVLGLFAVVVWRLLRTAAAARDRFGYLLAVGAGALVVFHVFVNVGMVQRLLPVTGVPLPLMSYGGSFYIAMALTLGMVHSTWVRRSPMPGERFFT
ncbi:MAG: rod shape-determining protein RodA [Actinobacteria bacterium RBG_16_70_17]|nr:MAG: rod shape-determining protein RodA [Actinobacteria bacterium RBG_16_70_17]